MRVLLDEQLPLDLASLLRGHVVETVTRRGWAGIKNGELLSRMSGPDDVLITMDRGIEFQQRVSTLPASSSFVPDPIAYRTWVL